MRTAETAAIPLPDAPDIPLKANAVIGDRAKEERFSAGWSRNEEPSASSSLPEEHNQIPAKAKRNPSALSNQKQAQVQALGEGPVRLKPVVSRTKKKGKGS